MSTRIVLTAIAVALVAVPVAGAQPLSGASIPVPLEPAANAARGDYWRAPRDRSLVFCRHGGLRSAGAPPVGRLLEIHVDVVVDRTGRRGA